MTITSTAVRVGTDAAAWTENNLDELRGILAATGVLRLQGLGESVAQFDAITTAVTGSAPLEYHGGATPRTRLDRNVYSSTDFPSEYAIDLHSEMAYAPTWPLHLAFCCVQPSETGGATPLAPTRDIAERLPGRLAAKLAAHGIRYRRAFSSMLGIDWRSAYGVENVDELTEEVSLRGETLEIVENTVSTWWTLPAFQTIDGEQSWFNQMVAFNVRTLPPDVRDDLLLVVGEEGIPKNTLFGDGTPFDDGDVAAVRDAVDAVSIAIPWNEGDLTIVDNRRFAHGRQPFTGSRQVRVCMTGEGTWR